MIDYIILGSLAIIIILLIIILARKINEANITERIGKIETNTVKELANFKTDMLKNMNENFDHVNDMMEYRLTQMNEKVNERLDENFAKSNRTFTNILERLSKIDEAQKKIDNLSTDIVSLQSILTDKKTRGIFGEVNLNHILANIFGENNNRIYQLQFLFPNNTIADAVIFAPLPLATFASDTSCDVAKSFLKNYIATVIQIAVIVIMFVVYAAMNNYIVGWMTAQGFGATKLINFIILCALGLGVMRSGSWSKKICGIGWYVDTSINDMEDIIC